MVYLPIVLDQKAARRVNAPYFNVADIGASNNCSDGHLWTVNAYSELAQRKPAKS